jgi:serine protease Do
MAVNKTGIVVGAVAAAGIAAAAFAGAGGLIPVADKGVRGPLIRTATQPVFAPPPGAPMSFADIFEKVSPAVVSIDVKSKVSVKEMLQQQGIPPQALPFFQGPRGGRGGRGGQNGPDGEEDDESPSQDALSSGSGFFISGDGYIVTNNHVVENASEITVTLKDERELKAKVVGRDEATDLAVIKVEGRNFPYVNFENAAKPRVGDWVLAVGNPFGLGGTATAGIVSAYGRDIHDQWVDFIQVDAAINRGNSGGPTFDTYGRVIGVNSAIFSPTGGSVGIGFAIPADVADNITKALISGGKVTRGFLGITPQTLEADDAEAFGLPRTQKGVHVSDVVAGGPAAAGGVMPGDIIVKLNDKPVTSQNELSRVVAGTHTGDTIKIDVLREGKPKTLTVRSGTRPPPDELARAGTEPNAPPASPARPQQAAPNALGLRMGSLDENARRTYGIKPDVRGAVIEGVRGSSDAATKGVVRGDVVVSVSGQQVSSPEDVDAALASAKKAGRPAVYLLLRRKDNQFGRSVKLAE